MMDKELIESINLSNKYIRSYRSDAFYESALAFQTMFEKEVSKPAAVEDEPKHQAPSYTANQNIQQIYTIKDVWYAIYISIGVIISIISNAISLVFILNIIFRLITLQLAFIIVLAAGVFGIYAGWKTWKAHQAGIIIDLSKGILSFTAEDIENTFWEIIISKQFFNHWQRINLPLNEILRIDNDTLKIGKGKSMVKRYGLNISGIFGSQQIVFTSKQKRDECRALLAYVLKEIRNGNVKFDFNLNTGLSNDGQ